MTILSEETKAFYNTRYDEPGDPELSEEDRLGEEFACDCLNVERQFLSIMWHFKGDGHNAACDAGLGVNTFISTDHGDLFWYICQCAVRGVSPRYMTFRPVADQVGIHITDIELDDIVVWLANWDKVPIGELPDLAAIIVEMADRRERAADHLRHAARLLRGQELGVYKDRQPIRENGRLRATPKLRGHFAVGY